VDQMQSTRSKLIELLSDNKDQYISGQRLSEQLHISRSAVWKQMKELEKAGYKIEGKAKMGYRILSSPDTINEFTIQWGLDTNWLGKKVIHLKQTPSTQTLAHQLAQENTGHGTVVIADEQTKGKGRMDRPWQSTRNKGIWMSIVLRPTIAPYLAPQLTLLAATVLADTIHEHTNVRPHIKWPNDILINNKKVAGILTEMQAEQDQIQYVIIGIGINVNQDYLDLPNANYKATSLKLETQKEWHMKQIVQSILEKLENQYLAYMDKGFPNVKDKWESYGYKIGENILVKTLKDTWQGTFLGIAEDGALRVKTSSGETKKLYSVEIDWFKEENKTYVKSPQFTRNER